MTVVMTGVIGVLCALALVAVLVMKSAGTAQMAATAADQAALAAAHDLLGGGVAGHPCLIARQVAERNDGHVQKCTELASSVQVIVTSGGASATARAGEPEEPP